MSKMIFEDPIILKEKLKYEKLWGEVQQYRIHSAADYLSYAFLQIFENEIESGQRVIDFGCGSGRSIFALLQANLKVDLVDFAANCLDVEVFLQTVAPGSVVRFIQACLWDLPQSLTPSSWGICFDVLEHIPMQQIDNTFKEMRKKIIRGALLAIDLQKDNMGDIIGESLHLTVQTSSWWRQKIEKFFVIREVLFEDEKKFLVAVCCS